MFCSICGENLAIADAMICRHCGLLYCKYCRKSLDASSQINLIDNEGQDKSPAIGTNVTMCKCNNGDIQSLEDLRGYLIQDFLSYKYQIQVIANEPVVHFQMLLDLREKLISYGKDFILLPDQFSFQKDPLSTFSMAEQFALEHLQDISYNIRALYGKLLINKELLIQSEELTQVNMKLSILAGKIEQFQQGFQSYFYTVLEDKKNFERMLEPYATYLESLQDNFQNLRKHLDDDERIFFISEPLSSNLAGTISRNIQLLITEKRIIFFRQTLKKFKKNVKIIKSITGLQITALLQKGRKFRSASMIIKLADENIDIASNKEQILTIEKYVKLLVENIRIPNPKEWKHWQIGRIWSSDSYYSSIDNLLRWELRTGLKNPYGMSYPSDAAYNSGSGSQAGNPYMNNDFPENVDTIEQQTQVLEFIDRQLERATQRIRVVEYMINDIKSRKNTMSINEFYSLYDQFSTKLKDLESERNSLLTHYSKGGRKPPLAFS